MLKEYRLTHRGILVADAEVASRFNRMDDPVSKREAMPEWSQQAHTQEIRNVESR
jgi:hypothetical protein